jgi:glycosyltransferase involved in cell wall biosynthesis
MNESDTSRVAFPKALDQSGPDIVVSVFCQTFNHEPYISDALEGIIKQQTDFRFEVIVHDDASTDETARIIRDYATQYPKLIRAIFQEENQYSKGGFKPLLYAVSCAKGSYIAICEGDDKWTDSHKLQTQIDALATHNDIDICFHPAKLFESDQDTKNLYGFHGNTKGVISPQRMIGGAVVPTASIMVSTHSLRSLPAWFYSEAPVGDFYLRVIASAHKGALYIPETMCVYRAGTPGSWSAHVGADPRRFLHNNERHLGVCDALDVHLGHRYSSDIVQFRNRLLIGRMAVLLKIGDLRELITDIARLLRNPLSLFKTLLHLAKLVGRKPVQSWQKISRNFSYSWTEKSDSNEQG